MDDDLGDLSEMMGDDYSGYDDSKGDPNIKPKPAPPPRLHSATETTLTITFPPQEQFISKIKAQAMPVVLVKDPQNPFSSFGPPGGVTVDVQNDHGEIMSATTCVFKSLRPGTRYITRLICTNPAGTTAGRISGKYLTGPVKPVAPTFLHAKPNSIFIKFPDQGLSGCQEISKLTIGVARAGTADPFGKGSKSGEMSDSSPKCSELKQARIQKLQPGSLYVFRLVVHNASGSATGAVSQPMLTMPGVPSRLREDSTKRTSSSVTVKFQPHGQHLTKLVIQYVKLTGVKKTFDLLMKESGKSFEIDNPREANHCTVTKLEGNSRYVFRLVATNPSGTSIGAVLGPIATVEFAPEMLDKSGWMFEVPPAQPKGLARRLSSRGKTTPKKYWYVIDGRLLNWFTDTDTREEVGFLHLSKLKRITYVPDGDGEARRFSLLLKNDTKITLECESTDPNVRTHEYTLSWMKAIQNALTAQSQPAEAKKEGRRSSIQPAAEEELEDLLEDEEEAEEDDGFGDEDWDDGFGGDDGEDGFGGFEDEEDGFGGDDDFGGDGFGAVDDDEGGEVFEDFDGGDEFGGFDEED